MSNKAEAKFLRYLEEAVAKVRNKHDDRCDFDLGARCGASSVAVEVYNIIRRDEELKRQGIEPGSV